MSNIFMYYEYKKDGYVYDITRNIVSRIKLIWHDPVKQEGSFQFYDNGFTHYLKYEELVKLYPYIGDNEEMVKVLYEK